MIVYKFSIYFCKIHIFSILKKIRMQKVFRKENAILNMLFFSVACYMFKIFDNIVQEENAEKKCLVFPVLLCHLKLNRHLCIIIEL